MLLVKTFILLTINIVEHVELVEGGNHPKILENHFFEAQKKMPTRLTTNRHHQNIILMKL